MKTKFCPKKKFCIILIYSLLFILLAFLIVDSYLDLNRDLEIQYANSIDMIDQRMNSLILEMNIFPGSIADDLLFLSKLSSLNDVFDFTSESKEKAIKNLEEDFLNYIQGSTIYHQLRYIDENGQEIVRAEFDGTDYYLISKNKLQNKIYRYYFSETIKLNKEEIYLSRLDLNIESERIENRGTEENPVYVPTIRIATPVFSYNKSKGIIIFNVYANSFLNDIRSAQRQGEKVFLINKEGFYIAHPDKNKEFYFVFGKNNTFYDDYPQIPREVLLDFNKRRFETEEQIFSFRHIYPAAGDLGIHKDSEKLIEEDYSWILVTLSNNSDINIVPNKLKKDYFYFLLFLIIIIWVIVLVFIFHHSNNKSTWRRK